MVLLLIIVLYNRYRLKQKSNKQLSKTLTELKDTQQQLVQSEKMAAFGLMASRVAHEIQNPLNFVNNFSELAQELVTDVINSESKEDKKQNADILIDNLQKINEHGKRAAGIVKQLQEHTRAGTAHEFFESDKT
jgi:C4-dicarboxylate-specific signal transduction histidine kinase